MNDTGLAQTMTPNYLSRIFAKNVYSDTCVAQALPIIPKEYKDFKTSNLPIAIEVCPTLSNASKSIFTEKKLYQCGKCNAFSNSKIKINPTSWQCSVCGYKNINKNGFVHCAADEYDWIQDPVNEKPLVLFIIQNSIFFGNQELLSSILSKIQVWADNNPNIDTSLLFIGQNVTVIDLQRPRAEIMIDADQIDLRVTTTDKARFAEISKSIKIERSNNFVEKLASAVNRIKRKTILLTLFASDIPERELPDDFRKCLSHRIITLHLFTTIGCKNSQMLKYSNRVRIFSDIEKTLIAPELEQWLSTEFMFNLNIKCYTSSTFKIDFIYSQYSSSMSSALLPFCDGQSSFAIYGGLARTPEFNNYIQLSILYTMPNGQRATRIITIPIKIAKDFENVDNIILASVFAKRTAHRLSFGDLQHDVFREMREEAIAMLAGVTRGGPYRKSIDEKFRDLPLLLFALERSELFRDDQLRMLAAISNIMTMSPARLLRALYPALFVAGLGFPQRLMAAETAKTDSAAVIGAFHGFVAGDPARVAPAAAVGPPLLLLPDKEELGAFLIEDPHPNFVSYTEQMEIDVNVNLY